MIKAFDPGEYFSKVQVPESWPCIEDFADWYMRSGQPLMIPWDAEVIASDDATAICLFRKAPYQVELYLVHPNIAIPVHSHPEMEAVIIRLGGGCLGDRLASGLSSEWGMFGGKTKESQTHGGRGFGFSTKGYAMLTFQKWPEGAQLTSAAVHWKGDTAGPKQDAIIKKHHPQAVAIPGFADITRRKVDAVL
jgi:hypothetical protein